MSISINNISYKYKISSPYVLKNVNVEIKNDTINILLGLNGCGKTTLLKLLVGLLKLEEGKIIYDGNEISNLSIKERSKIFSYVSQKIIGADDFLVKDYLTYGLVNSLKFYQSPNDKQLEKIEKIAEKLGIIHILNKKIGEISGGEKQIVSIAVCLVQNTPIIILDEPTASLDLNNQYKFLLLIKEIVKNGKTIIFSSHNPNQALFLDSNVILMHKGIIKMAGNSKDVIKISNLKSVYGNNICLSKELDYDEISFK